MAKRPAPTGYYADEESVVRLVRPVFSWSEYVELAFGEIIEYGNSSSQVRQSLSNAFDQLLKAVSESYRPPIDRQRDRLLRSQGYDTDV